MLTAGEVLGTYFLDIRCQLLEIGAMLDRLDRAAALPAIRWPTNGWSRSTSLCSCWPNARRRPTGLNGC